MNIHRILRISQRIHAQVSRQHRFCQVLNREKTVFPLNNLQKKQLIKTPLCTHSTNAVKEDGFFRKLLKSIPFLGINRTKMKFVAYLHYETIADEVNHIEFFDTLDLADTFYSWFVVTELHMWMISARAMAEGDEGRFIRNNMVEALWADVLLRVKKLGVTGNVVETREKIVELSEQLQATFIAYDEGLQAEDIVLAGALWRRFYQQQDVDLEHLELLVKYIRKNMRMLECINSEEFINPKNIKWIPLGS